MTKATWPTLSLSMGFGGVRTIKTGGLVGVPDDDDDDDKEGEGFILDTMLVTVDHTPFRLKSYTSWLLALYVLTIPKAACETTGSSFKANPWMTGMYRCEVKGKPLVRTAPVMIRDVAIMILRRD
jgi:hypothetical protein